MRQLIRNTIKIQERMKKVKEFFQNNDVTLKTRLTSHRKQERRDRKCCFLSSIKMLKRFIHFWDNVSLLWVSGFYLDAFK